MKPAKPGWNALLICEIVFGIIGVIFTALGAVFGVFIEEIAASPNAQGDVYILPWVFGGIGVVFLLTFAVLLAVTISQRKTRTRLLESGTYINACVTEIQQDLTVRINYRHPFYLICQGTNPYTGEKLIFKSDNMMENPAHLLGKTLRVFLDYENPKHYYVEVQRSYDA